MSAPSSWQEGDLLSNNIRLHYFRTGGAKRQLVLAHGYSDNALCWLRVARNLEADFDVILYDARGHGHSEAPEHGYSYDDRAADLAGLVQGLHLERPAVLGHSMGAQTVAVFAGSYPALLICAVLEDPPWIEPEEAVRRGRVRDAAWLERERQHIAERNQQTLEAQIAFEQGMNAEWTEEDVAQAACAKLAMSPHNAETIADPPYTWRDLAKRIACPTLLMMGDSGRGALVTPELAANALPLLPAGSRVGTFLSGHSIHRVVFSEFIASVRSFLAMYM
ncbi:MAG: alpha/beta fold hydrolase [Anaerolineae bacterium]